MRVLLGIIILMMPFCVTPFAISAQSVGVIQSEYLVIDPERLFAETTLGKRISAGLQAEFQELSEENKTLQQELEAEELTLTELRSEKTAEEFRELADAFDEKVRKIREERDAAVRTLERKSEVAPRAFMRSIEPILSALLQESGATVLLDRRDVLMHDPQIDITEMAINRVNQSIQQAQSEEGSQ